jgi:lipopolysaccharide transport system permease protein
MAHSSVAHVTRRSELLYMLAWRDIRVRYKQSVMGFLWAVLTPTLVVGAGIVVGAGMARYSGRSITFDHVAAIMVRAIAWTFFTSAIRFGSSSLLGNASLVTKVAFPRETFPMAAVLSSLFDFAIATTVLLAVLLFSGWAPSLHFLWAALLFGILIAFTTGLTLLLSAANLFLRDVKYLVEIILTYAIFLTPVLYDASFVGTWRNVLMLNPIAPIMEGLSVSIIGHRTPDLPWVAYSAAVAVAMLAFGAWSFKRLEPRFAESI